MTSIAYDGELLCSDSRATCGYINQINFQKIFLSENKNYMAFAFSGTYGDKDAMLNWILKGGDRPDFADKRNNILMIKANGEAIDFWSSTLGPEPAGIPVASGSGAEYAMGAMLAGVNAYRAIEIACKLDPDSGGPIQCFNMKTRILTGPFA